MRRTPPRLILPPLLGEKRLPKRMKFASQRSRIPRSEVFIRCALFQKIKAQSIGNGSGYGVGVPDGESVKTPLTLNQLIRRSDFVSDVWSGDSFSVVPSSTSGDIVILD